MIWKQKQKMAPDELPRSNYESTTHFVFIYFFRLDLLRFDFFNWEKKGLFGPIKILFSFLNEKKNGEKIGGNKIRTFVVWSDEPIQLVEY